MTLRYPTVAVCKELLFPIVDKEMAVAEPAPPYAFEQRGLNKLESTFHLMERDEYEGLLAKAAYLFCSVIDSHPFSNGNKRLAVTLLTYFLVVNGYRIHAPNMDAVRLEFERLFPLLRWENVHAFRRSHEYFFYHLALIIADRSQKGKLNFSQEQSAVKELLAFIASKN